MVCGEFEKCGSVHYIKGLDMDVPERRVTLVNNGILGMNIRGGSEFGLGVYVSRSVITSAILLTVITNYKLHDTIQLQHVTSTYPNSFLPYISALTPGDRQRARE